MSERLLLSRRPSTTKMRFGGLPQVESVQLGGKGGKATSVLTGLVGPEIFSLWEEAVVAASSANPEPGCGGRPRGPSRRVAGLARAAPQHIPPPLEKEATPSLGSRTSQIKCKQRLCVRLFTSCPRKPKRASCFAFPLATSGKRAWPLFPSSIAGFRRAIRSPTVPQNSCFSSFP